MKIYMKRITSATVTVEIVKAKQLKIGDRVLFANKAAEITRIEGEFVWIGFTKTRYIFYYRIIEEKVVFT